MTAARRIPGVLLLGVIVIAGAVLCAPLRRQYDRHRMKVTVTHMSQVGRSCMVTKADTTVCEDILRSAGVNLSPETCTDGWGKRITIHATRDAAGSVHYTLSALGPNEDGNPAFVWTDGEWQKVMPGTPP